MLYPAVQPSLTVAGTGRACAALVCVVCLACDPRPRVDGAGDVAVDSAGVRIVTSPAGTVDWIVSPEPELSLGTVDRGGPTDFFRLGEVRFLPSDRIVLTNGGTQELRFFSTRGDFLGSAGGTGRGPDEFEGLSWVAPFGDSLLTHDSWNDRVSVRDGLGRLSRTFRVERPWGLTSAVALAAGGSLLTVAMRRMTEMSESGTFVEQGLVSIHDLRGSMIDSIGRIPLAHRVVLRDGIRRTTLGLPYLGAAGFAAAGRGYCHAFGAGFEVRCHGPDGSLELVARVALEARPFDPGLATRLWDHDLEAARAADNQPRIQAIERIRRIAVFPKHLPGLDQLRVDSGGRLWARVFRLPDATLTEWWIFEDGRRVGRLAVPAAFELKDVDVDRIIGVWTDALGVEYVRIYPYESA